MFSTTVIRVLSCLIFASALLILLLAISLAHNYTAPSFISTDTFKTSWHKAASISGNIHYKIRNNDNEKQ